MRVQNHFSKLMRSPAGMAQLRTEKTPWLVCDVGKMFQTREMGLRVESRRVGIPLMRCVVSILITATMQRHFLHRQGGYTGSEQIMT